MKRLPWLPVGLSLGLVLCPLHWLGAIPPLSSTALPGLGPEEEIAAADAARLSGNLPVAEQGYRQVLAEFDDPAADPDRVARREGLLALLASVQVAQREYDAALPNLTRYVAAYPQGPAFEELLFWKGFAEFRLGRPEAEATLRDFLKRYPQGARTFEARRSLGLLWRGKKQYKEAAELFAALSQNDDPHRAEEARLLEFSTRVEMGDEAGAGDLAAHFLGDDPELVRTDRAVALSLLAFRAGAALLDHGQPRPALAVLRRLTLWPRCPGTPPSSRCATPSMPISGSWRRSPITTGRSACEPLWPTRPWDGAGRPRSCSPNPCPPGRRVRPVSPPPWRWPTPIATWAAGTIW